MNRFIKIISLVLIITGVSIMFSSCRLFSFIQNIREDSKLWKELEESIDDDVAAKDTTSFHNARYQVKSRIIMSDIERLSSEHIIDLFSPRIVSEIGEEKLQASIEEMETMIQGEVLSYKTVQSGGSGQRGGSGATTNTYKIAVYTDMDIYEMYLRYVTVDTSSNEWDVNKANEGLHHFVVFPVGMACAEEEAGNSLYASYLDKEGVFFETTAEPARNITYPEKGYTGYSIAYLQEQRYESGRKKLCENLMELLDSVGFEGDITQISYTSEENFEAAYSQDYNLAITDTSQNIFFVRTSKYENNTCIQGLKIANATLQVLYEELPQ